MGGSKTLGATVQRLRHQRQLTQAELAKAVGIHRISLAQIEGGAKRPSLATLERIAKALGVPPARLLA
jgi:transcriptional regulator with XRE-family HTH domain